MTMPADPAAHKMAGSRMKSTCEFFFLVLAEFFLAVYGSSGFGDRGLGVQKYLRWNYTEVNMNCSFPGTHAPCMDIRICDFATASLAMGGWPTLCGWVGKGVPKVCCDLRMVLGKKLMEKVDEERARKRRCGTRGFERNLSETEAEFYEIVRSLPPVDISDPNIFDPPLASTEYTKSPVGGEPSLQGQFPWMVSIKKAGKQWCSGTLIDRSHILSAAHCFVNNRRKPDPNDYIVLVGDIYADEGYPFYVRKIAIHPDYQPPYYYHDLAILTLSKEILTPFIAHICLPSPEIANTDFSGRKTTLLGFGRTSLGGHMTSMLHVVDDLPVISSSECKTTYRRTEYLPKGLTEDFICAGLEEGGKDTCRIDSGGPLMYKNNHQNLLDSYQDVPWIQVGVVSFGFMCGEPGFPGVYTKLASHMEWITKTMDE